MHNSYLSDDEQHQLITKGFVVIKQALTKQTVTQAKTLIEDALPKDERRLLVPPELATHEKVIGLLNDSCVPEILHRYMGPFPDVISCQVAVTPPGDNLGGGPGPHVDGSWSGEIPLSADEIDPTKGRPIDAAKYFGANDDIRGANDGQLWIDPEQRISIGSYTTLVGVALNDQLVPGHGQFAVMEGLHEQVEAHFRKQRDSGSVIGPEGLDWPRIMISPSGQPFCNGLPHPVRNLAHQHAKEAGREATAQWPWPELTPVCLEAGDAVIALHACPHTPTPNMGPNPRMNVYFRIRKLREENPHEGSRRIGHGVSDHPDRGYFGQFLDYPDEYDPWQTSIDKLCDHWSEWPGLQSKVQEYKEAGILPTL